MPAIDKSESARKERERYFSGLSKAAKMVDQLLDNGGFVQAYNAVAKKEEERIFSVQEQQELESLKKEAEKKARQIIANHFVVAVVGRTCSGKSVATNAIVVGKNLLPFSDDECTRAKTEIRYAAESKAEVTFYSKKEFHDNFVDVLKKIPHFPQKLADKASGFAIDTVSEYQNFKGRFEGWVKEGETNKIQKGCKEIQSILDNISTIWEYLGKKNELLIHVTRKNLEPYIANEAVSPAVKGIVIYSPILQEMNNAIFRDMPGYGSTTKTFTTLSAQTMIDADAVLLVRDALETYDTDNAQSVFSEALSMLKTAEEKRRFTEKIFFFINKADLCYDLDGLLEKHINRSMAILERPDSEFQNILKNHTIIGSALAFAPENELSPDEENSKDKAKQNLINLGLYTDGTASCVEIIRNKLQQFNDTIRQAARIAEAETIQAKLLSILKRYQNEYVPDGQIDLRFRENYKRRLTKSLNDYNQRVSIQYTGKEPDASKEIIEAGVKALEKELQGFHAEDSDWKEMMFTDGWSSIHSALPADYYFRSRKRTKLKQAFEEAMKTSQIPNLGVFDPAFTTIFTVVQNCMISSMDVDPGGLYYKELRQAAGEFLDSLNDEAVKQAKQTKCNFDTYVDDLFTLLITTPFHSPERWDFFHLVDNQKDFYELDQAYKEKHPDLAEEDYFPLITKMLFHKDRKSIAARYKKKLEAILTENGYDSTDIDQAKDVIEPFVMKRLDQIETISLPEGNLSDVLTALDDEEKNLPPRGYASCHYKTEINYKTVDADASETPCRERMLSKCENDVIQEYKEDLAILIDAMKNALPYCIRMEKDAKNIVQNLCERINQVYKDKICDWIEGNQNIREWMLQSRSSIYDARNHALQQVNKSYIELCDWLPAETGNGQPDGDSHKKI